MFDMLIRDYRDGHRRIRIVCIGCGAFSERGVHRDGDLLGVGRKMALRTFDRNAFFHSFDCPYYETDESGSAESALSLPPS